MEQAGFEAVTGDISSETRAKLDMPLMSVMDYVKYIGMYMSRTATAFTFYQKSGKIEE